MTSKMNPTYTYHHKNNKSNYKNKNQKKLKLKFKAFGYTNKLMFVPYVMLSKFNILLIFTETCY